MKSKAYTNSTKKEKTSKKINNDIEELFFLEDIKDGISITRNGYGAFIEVFPINFSLRSDREKNRIILKFNELLKVMKVPFWLFTISKRADLKEHIEYIGKYSEIEENEEVKNLTAEYIVSAQNVAQKNSVKRRFIIYIPCELAKVKKLDFDEAKDWLNQRCEDFREKIRACGNDYKISNDNQFTAQILFELLCAETSNMSRVPKILLEILEMKELINKQEREIRERNERKVITKKKRRRKKAEADDGEKIVNISAFRNVDFGNNTYVHSLKTYKDYILPEAIDVAESPYYLKVDRSYVSTLVCTGWPYEAKMGFLNELISFDEGVEIALYFQPQNKAKINTEITNALGFTKAKMSDGDNQMDSAVQENAHDASVYIKKQLSKDDEFYYINLLVKVKADSSEALSKKIRRVENKMAGMDLSYTMADYRQLEAFTSALPLDNFDKRYEKISRRNILASGLAGMYPFTSTTLCDPEGMFMGINQHDMSQIILDLFNTDEYTNANMIIAGKSGAGKTFTTQMIAGRFRMQRIPTILIAPLKGHEYRPYCENLGGNYFKFVPGGDNNVNIMEIRPTKQVGREKASYLAEHVQWLKIALSLIIPDLTSRELRLLDKPIMETYLEKGITNDNSSLYEDAQFESNKVVNLRPKVKKMPLLEDLCRNIGKVEELKRLVDELEPLIQGSLSSFNAQTNVDFSNLYTVADVSDMPEDLIPFAMFVVLKPAWELIKRDVTQRKAIILDELWKLIGISGNSKVAEFILEIFKIIRGYGGSAIGTTQDINDFFMLEDGKYGKGILNAASLKIVMGLEELDALKMQEVLKLSEMELSEIENFDRGQGLICAGKNHVVVEFKPFKTEERLINTDRKKLIEYGKEVG